MDFNLKQPASELDHVVTDTHVYFWHAPSFGNWTICPFEMNGEQFNCSEQGLMWKKAMLFDDKKVADQILKTVDPKKHKALGRKVRGFDDEQWKAKRCDFMLEVLRCKFTQNADYHQALIDTGDKTLVEASSRDNIWGVKMTAAQCIAGGEDDTKWKGLNLLGKALMQLRDELRSSGGNESGPTESETEQKEDESV